MSGPSDNFVALVAVLVIFGLPIAYGITNRILAHHERLEMIKRGIVPPPDRRTARQMAREGYTAQQYAGPIDQSDFYPDRMLRKGVTIGMIGMALLIGLSFIRPGTPGPWLLGGLIPLFIGLAQVILAMMSGARFGTVTYTAPPPPPQDRWTVSPPPQQQGPYAWRPGPTTELERPVRPPDIKQ